jgi:signal transduction histidine kinase
MTIQTGEMAPIELPFRPPEACKVLVADDDPRIIDVFITFLSRDGYQVLTATDGQAALELVAAEQPDLVVLDIMLPILDGLIVCQHIKQTPMTRFLPVILFTGATDRSKRLESLRAGADDFLRKPLDPLELTTRVRSLLRTRQLYEQLEEHQRELEERQHELEAYQRELEKRVEDRTRELREANRRLEALSKVKSNVLAMVSHELRTPLHHADIALQLVQQEGLDPDERAQLYEQMDQAFRQLEYRLDTVETFSDPGEVKLAPASAADLLYGALERIRSIQGDEVDSIEIVVERHLPPVLVDAGRMTRAIGHLIDNAIKFGEGKPISLEAAHRDGNVWIAVRDHGSGIPDTLWPVLFSPLVTGDNSSTRRHGGMGIGLSLVKMVLDAHNVDLLVESAPGEGTTVGFRLPSTII